eukprot:m.12862 g.12862  ORF g.12862 m.12862 type:complete len:172 (+) comp5876_c0_seq2:191-706(+)
MAAKESGGVESAVAGEGSHGPMNVPVINQEDPFIMHVILRADLITKLGWPVGSVVAQGCHAVSAVLATHMDNPDVQAYLKDVSHLTKAVVQVRNEAKLRNLSAKLTEKGVQHHLWLELPENIPTAIATVPTRKSNVDKAVRKLQLFQDPFPRTSTAEGKVKQREADAAPSL